MKIASRIGLAGALVAAAIGLGAVSATPAYAATTQCQFLNIIYEQCTKTTGTGLVLGTLSLDPRTKFAPLALV